MFAQPWQCDSWKKALWTRRKMLRVGASAKRHIAKFCACHEKTTRLHWRDSKVLRLSRKTQKWPPSLWLGNAKTSISCETSFTFHTLKEMIVSHSVCAAYRKRITDDATTRRRPDDDDTTATRPTRPRILVVLACAVGAGIVAWHWRQNKTIVPEEPDWVCVGGFNLQRGDPRGVHDHC